jgi:hypothetical protein
MGVRGRNITRGATWLSRLLIIRVYHTGFAAQVPNGTAKGRQ